MITFKQWLIQTGQLPDSKLKTRPKSAKEKKQYEAILDTVKQKLYESFYDYRLIDTRKEKVASK